MSLFNPINIEPMNRIQLEKSFENISKLIKKYLGQDKSEKFINNCEHFDNDNIKETNSILNELIITLTGQSESTDIFQALTIFSEKFSQLSSFNDEFSKTITEIEKVTVISKYSEDILRIIEGKED